MDQGVKAKWVKALRSRKYKQGQSFLAQEYRGKVYHCCLGVLCDIAVREGVIPSASRIEGNEPLYFGNEMKFPPSEVLEWAGLPRKELSTGNPLLILAGMNDDGNKSFGYIAAYIDTNL